MLKISATVCFLEAPYMKYRTEQAFGLLNKTTQKCFANLCSSFFLFYAQTSEH